MPTVFIEPIDTSGWTAEQSAHQRAFWPVLRPYLAAQMRNQPACDRFFDAQQAVTKVRHIDISEWQTAVRIPVMNRLGLHIRRPGCRQAVLRAVSPAGRGHLPVHELTPPAAWRRPSSPARSITRRAQLVDYLVTLGVTEAELPPLMELCKRL